MVVIGVTDESPELVDTWVGRLKPDYPVVILANGDFEDALDVKFFPTGAVVRPDGTLAFSGSASKAHQVLEEVRGAASPGELVSKAARKALSKALEAVAEDEYGTAYEEVLDLAKQGALEGDLATWVPRFQEFLEGRAQSELDRAKELLEEGLVMRAVLAVDPIADARTPYPATETAKAWRAELEAMPDFKTELKAGTAYEKAAALLREGEYTKAVKALRSLIKKYEGTRTAGAAYDKAKELVDKGLPGYKPHCKYCNEGKRACDKHADDIEL